MRLMENKPVREKMLLIYTIIILIAGLTELLYESFHMSEVSNVWIYITIVCLMAVVEWFPLDIWKNPTTFRFPFIFLLISYFGFPVAVVTTSLLIFLIYMIKSRPFRLWFFTPAKIALSLLASLGFTTMLFPQFSAGMTGEPLKGLIFIGIYFFVSNALADVLILLRFTRFPSGVFLLKNAIEAGVALISAIYLWALSQSGGQFGNLHGLPFAFFISPPIAFAIISFMALHLQKHHTRSKYLVTLTRELNRLLLSDEWRKKIEHLFRNFIAVEASGFWVKVGTDWLLYHRNGEIKADYELPPQYKSEFAKLNEIKVIRNRYKENIPANDYFSSDIKSFIFAPLTIENESLGMLVVARRRANSFTTDEIRSVLTFANQAAVLLKNHRLFSEQEKRSLLEERNRIAREIHDGLAQSLAGAILKLETAERLMTADTEKAEQLIHTITEKLRLSLGEVRESIYELRPYLTEQIGLRRAIRGKLREVENEGGPHIIFKEFGQVSVLDEEVKRIIYELIQESLYNCVKHAEASTVWITLRYMENDVELEIKDDGEGFSLADAMMKARKEPHFGILNMNEQAESIGGSLQIDSCIGEGTTIQFKAKNDPGEVLGNDSSDVG